MRRLHRFLLSDSHLAGCASAALVTVLYLLGVIQAYWWALAAVAYVPGYLALMRPKPAHLPENLNSQDALHWLEMQVLPKFSGEPRALLESLLAKATDLMPRLKELEAQGVVQADNRALLKQTLTRYLPDVVEAYLRLPPMYARTARVADGKTPQGLLLEQLGVLNAHVDELQQKLLSAEVDGLLANGRFLQERFSKAVRFD